MKIAVVTDIHIGCRNASPLFAEYQLKFFEKAFLKYIQKVGIDTIICCGDMFDTRKFSNHVIIDMWYSRFFDVLEKSGISMHLIIGNHDSALRNTLSVNSPRLFLSKYKNITIYDSPKTVQFDGTDILFLPWICDGNYAESMDVIDKTPAQVVFGHLELANFEMHKGQVHDDGMDEAIFKRFEAVYSGHYHHRSHRGNITYLGCPTEFTWIDFGDPKGFHVFDTETGAVKFFRNPFSMFHKIEYNDSIGIDWAEFDLAPFEDTYVKIVVVEKTDNKKFDSFIERCYRSNFADLKIIETILDDTDELEDDNLEVESSMSLVDSFVDSTSVSCDKKLLKTALQSFYVQAMEEI